jgi:hypothetical protein
MKVPGLPLLIIALASAMPAAAQDRKVPGQALPALSAAQRQAKTGDVAGGRFIPQPILDILGDPRIDPNIAYIFWQTSRKPIDEWTMSEVGFVTSVAATLLEAGIPLIKIQTLYQFWGFDPRDIFNPSFGADWQSQSTAYDPRNAGNVLSISSAECQVDVNLMTVATFRACSSGQRGY